MKTLKSSEQRWPEAPFISSGRDKSTARKLQAAIETVFRLTHRRDMTKQERLMFGLPAANGNHSNAQDKLSHNGNSSKKRSR